MFAQESTIVRAVTSTVTGRRWVTILVGVPSFGAISVGDAHGSTAAAARATPKIACYDLPSNRLKGYFSQPKECWLKPRWTGFGNVLIGARWSSWGTSSAAGRGTSFRLWADIKVRLSAPRRVCGTTLFTRAHVHYVGGGDEYWPDKTYTLRTC